MAYETAIDEPVKVWAFFDPSTSSGQSRIFPIAVSWQRRLIKFKKIIFTSSKRVGQVKIFNFICASDTANYELEYNSENHMWKVKKVMPR